MDPSAITTSLQSTFDSLGITELTGLMITITAMSGSFYFLVGIVRPPITALWLRLKELMFYEVSVYVADPDYQKFNIWLNDQHKYTWFQRTYKVVNADDNHQHFHMDDSENAAETKLAPGYGSVMIKAPGQPFVWVTRTKTESKQVWRQTEVLTFKIFSINPEAVNKFFLAVIGAGEEEKEPSVYSYQHDYWSDIGKPKIVLPPLGEPAIEFLADVEYFLNHKNEYIERGIPYKKGYLLFGPPGTGKTSIIAYMARKFEMDIYTLNSTTITSFQSSAVDIKSGSIILIEDIDMTVAGDARDLTDDDKKEKTPKQNTTIKDAMRGFLNALDGITKFEGNVIIATTNKKDVLDPALLRPGRIDKLIEITPFTNIEQIEHINNFYKIDLNVNDYTHAKSRTFAELQNLCVNNIDDYSKVVDQL